MVYGNTFLGLRGNRDEMFFSLVLPAYNEAKALPAAVEAARRELRKIKGLRFELIIAEDGARDDTPLWRSVLRVASRKCATCTARSAWAAA